MTLTCPHCGQRVLLRLGVHLSPRRADVFDAIQRQSKYGGISTDALVAMFGKIGCVRVHISDINKLLAAKGWEIVCEREGSRKGFYRIRRSKRYAGTAGHGRRLGRPVQPNGSASGESASASAEAARARTGDAGG